ncbi:MAG: hypothetical protein JNM93_14445 [Bacteriovoracaceae bacterium]|nr:hypothetical protein [Bacteriovoracaceae bacterium]
MNAKVILGCRILLGLIFTVFGLNGLMMIFTGAGFIPMPPPSPEMGAIMGGFFSAKYLMPLVKLLQVVSGIMLLTNKYVNAALTFLGPIIVNILGIHLFVDLAGAPMAIFITVLWAILVCSRWNSFKPLLTA